MSDIIDDYEHLDGNLEYILENVLCEEISSKPYQNNESTKYLIDEYNSILKNGCNCVDNSEKTCSNHEKCNHAGNYEILHYNSNNSAEIILNFEKDLRKPIYECTAQCKCRRNGCQNRCVQFGPRKYLEIIDSKLYKSQGLKTKRKIAKGGFICEYAGELLTPDVAQERFNANELQNKMNYILCLNEINSCDGPGKKERQYQTIVDPSRRGNIGRYLNHSCEPNCEAFSVRVDCPVPKIGIFAKRDIEANEELCFHYGGGERRCEYDQSSARQEADTNTKRLIPCLCGAKTCDKFLPNMML